jgi:predicted transposase YdaD
MSTPHDDSFKTLVRDDPLAFIHLVFPKAQLVRQLREKLKEWKLEVDALFEILLENGEPMLVHIEFQTYNDPEMPKRLLRYNILTWSEYNIPVYSCVIHVLRDGKLPTSPFRLKVGTGKQVIQFDFDVIELGELSPEEILQTGQANLFPLLPFTRGGARREVVETVFEELTEAGKSNLLSVAQTLASLAFRRENNTADQEWLIRRYKQMFDIVKDTPLYQEMFRDAREEAREEALKEGREEGLKEGLEKAQQEKLEALRRALIGIVQARFPRLEKLARGQAAITDDEDEINDLIVKLSMARDGKEAKRCLIGDEDEEEG